MRSGTPQRSPAVRGGTGGASSMSSAAPRARRCGTGSSGKTASSRVPSRSARPANASRMSLCDGTVRSTVYPSPAARSSPARSRVVFPAPATPASTSTARARPDPQPSQERLQHTQLGIPARIRPRTWQQTPRAPLTTTGPDAAKTAKLCGFPRSRAARVPIASRVGDPAPSPETHLTTTGEETTMLRHRNRLIAAAGAVVTAEAIATAGVMTAAAAPSGAQTLKFTAVQKGTIGFGKAAARHPGHRCQRGGQDRGLRHAVPRVHVAEQRHRELHRGHQWRVPVRHVQHQLKSGTVTNGKVTGGTGAFQPEPPERSRSRPSPAPSTPSRSPTAASQARQPHGGGTVAAARTSALLDQDQHPRATLPAGQTLAGSGDGPRL